MPTMDEMGRTKYDEMKDENKWVLIVLKDIGKKKVSFLKKKNHHQNVLFIRVKRSIKLLFPAFVLTKEFLKR